MATGGIVCGETLDSCVRIVILKHHLILGKVKRGCSSKVEHLVANEKVGFRLPSPALRAYSLGRRSDCKPDLEGAIPSGLSNLHALVLVDPSMCLLSTLREFDSRRGCKDHLSVVADLRTGLRNQLSRFNSWRRGQAANSCTARRRLSRRRAFALIVAAWEPRIKFPHEFRWKPATMLWRSAHPFVLADPGTTLRRSMFVFDSRRRGRGAGGHSFPTEPHKLRNAGATLPPQPLPRQRSERGASHKGDRDGATPSAATKVM